MAIRTNDHLWNPDCYDAIRDAVLKPGMERDDIIKIYGQDLDMAVSMEATPFNVSFVYHQDEVIAVSVYKSPEMADIDNLKTKFLNVLHFFPLFVLFLQ